MFPLQSRSGAIPSNRPMVGNSSQVSGLERCWFIVIPGCKFLFNSCPYGLWMHFFLMFIWSWVVYIPIIGQRLDFLINFPGTLTLTSIIALFDGGTGNVLYKNVTSSETSLEMDVVRQQVYCVETTSKMKTLTSMSYSLFSTCPYLKLSTFRLVIVNFLSTI